LKASDSEMLKFSKKGQLKKTISKSEFKDIYSDETALQRQCEQLLDFLHITYIRIPDEAYKALFYNEYIPTWIKQILSRYLKGLPDLTILHKDGTYQCIELKTKKGRQSQGQKHFQSGVKNYHIVKSFEEFQSIINRRQK
jgi:hypothetical protein